MGNYCSSGQTKKDKDNSSEKSEESPSYQLVDKNNKKQNNSFKDAPLADPEPISDVSTTTGQNTSPIENASELKQLPTTKPLHNLQSLLSTTDSVTSSPLASTPPCDLLTSPEFKIKLPPNLTPLYGRPGVNRRIEKIVVIILAAENLRKSDLTSLKKVYRNLRRKCDARGYELVLSNLHSDVSEAEKVKVFDVNTWLNGPLEAQGGHEVAANILAEISRHSHCSYLIPVLYLGENLGNPLLPLTIEKQDFCTALTTAETDGVSGKELLEKWYTLDNRAQPSCYRLRAKQTINNQSPEECCEELVQLLFVLVQIFSKELRDSYLTTVVEQEINNTVLMSQELSKRCIWVHTGHIPRRSPDHMTKLDDEMHRRLLNLHNELKNQLSDKHILRGTTCDQLETTLEQIISVEIDSLMDEHSTKFSIPHCTFGVDRKILLELEEVNRRSLILGQNCANFAIMDRIKNYITGSSTSPLIIFGKSGSGKSVLSAKIAENIHSWMPECGFVMRYVGLTSESSNLIAILGQICDQVHVLTNGTYVQGPHTYECYSSALKSALESTKYQIVILIDSLDSALGLDNLDWLPSKLQENIKVIITVTSNITDITESVDSSVKESKGDWILNEMKKIQSISVNFIHLTQFSQEQWNDVLNYGGCDIYAANGSLQLPEEWKKSDEKFPMQAKILWWLAWLGINHLESVTLDTVSNKIFDCLEAEFEANLIRFIFSALIATREGIMETEMVALLQKNFSDDKANELWIKFCWIMGPLLMNNKNITIMDSVIQSAARKRYQNDCKLRSGDLKCFYMEQEDVFVNEGGKENFFNTRKFIELPFHAYQTDEQSFSTSIYLTDLKWISNKLNTTGCVQVLNDISLSQAVSEKKHLQFLRKFIEMYFKPLNYDSKQFYSLFSEFLLEEGPNYYGASEIVKQWQEGMKSVTDVYLEKLISVEETPNADAAAPMNYDLVTNLPVKGYFVISLVTNREEICVWNAAKNVKIRTLRGIPQPSAICPVGDYGVAVLCKREIKVIDLDEGKFKVTLKGVMNQKMPYFGLHDPNHVVCLSRNRMYVNLMNLETGDCVTTFKAGEDRFLNSLLVSGDGRILVCGDETQKPFPLLVWHLSQRKLLYDLRIPHHDFMTSLSAITHEGSYVCVVAKELNEPAPNFIVVYDLQSGTLFKKWKPSCNTVSLAISQTNACVIAGLEDARILVWDLVTGNCKYTLIGHNAPITLLKLDPTGKVLMSCNKDGRDMSIRLWELDTGKRLAVYTPPAKVMTCEILPNGKYVVLALENSANLITLKLKGHSLSDTDSDNFTYGNKENEGKIFDL